MNHQEMQLCCGNMQIVSQLSISADILAVLAKRIETIINADIKEPYAYNLIRKMVYTNRIIVAKSTTEIEKMRSLANYICKQNKEAVLSVIDYKDKLKAEYKREYFLIFPFTSVSDKNWEQEKIAKVIEWIHQLGHESVNV